VLRPSLLPGLLDALRHNVSRKNYDVALFELGRVFSPQSNPAAATEASQARTDSPSGALPIGEARRIAIGLTGQRHPLFWSGSERDAKFDIYDLKGLLEEFFGHYGARGITFTRRPESSELFLESATIQLGKFQLGQMGQLLPALAKQYDLRDAALLAELDLEVLLTRRNTGKSFKSLPAYPTVRRDLAILVPEATTHDEVLQAVRQAKVQSLETVDLFDVFRGKNVPAGQKSMAYAFTYRHADRTLTDSEVNTAHTQLVAHLKQRLSAVVRE
jgi:phenylalanyl-tRNA synthetase beta chain